MPNGNHIQSSGITNIPWPNLHSTATKAHILPALNPHSLVSTGVLCDHNCTATFDKHAVTIQRHNQPILTGPRLPNGRWTLPLPHDRSKHHAYTLFTPKTQQQLVQWIHTAAFSRSPSTFLHEIQRTFFATWPGLTANIVQRHLTQTDAIVKGHLDQQRQRKCKHPSQEEQPITSTGTRSHTVSATILDPATLFAAPTATSLVGMIAQDLDSMIPGESFKGLFCQDSLCIRYPFL